MLLRLLLAILFEFVSYQKTNKEDFKLVVVSGST